MRVVAFAPARKAVVEEAGGVTAEGFPMTSCYVDSFPTQLTLPIVVAVYTEGGSEYDPRRYIVALAPDGERVGLLEFAWHWPDSAGVPVKFRVFAQHLPMRVPSAGVYTVALYESLETRDPDDLFPLPVSKLNGPTAPPSQAGRHQSPRSP